VEFKINIQKKHFYLLILLIVAVGFVIAQGGKPNPGHTTAEIEGLEAALKGDSKVTSGRVNHGDMIVPIKGFKKYECNILLSMEDSHVGTQGKTKREPNYEDKFGDLGYWGDNIYGGAQAFTTSLIRSERWEVTCRFGFHWSYGNPVWIPAKCKYLMICSK